jgi:hypothetical protein
MEWSPQIHAEFHGFRITWVPFKSGRLISSTGLSPSMVHLPRKIRLSLGMVTDRKVLRLSKNGPATPHAHRRKAVTCRWFRLLPFRSPLLRESHSLSSPPLTEMFQFSGLPLPVLCVHTGVTQVHCAGLPHSGISGYAPACGSPKLFVACYALHRL